MVLLSKGETPKAPSKPHAKEFRGVYYPEITTDEGIKCSFVHDARIGSEFRAYMWGRPQVIVAHDASTYWFWIRSYDPKRYYFCELSESASVDLIPPLRPSFCRWLANQGNQKSERFIDGPYTVEIEAKDGFITTQRYTIDGRIEAEVRVLASQESAGMMFPAIAEIEMPDLHLKTIVNLGPAEANPEERPDFDPPEGLRARDLAP